ncbi:MAG TPA: NPCBM/NEW2 domain-containing protein, partial [bacterium]|nr:NPCBM/NEW2 domain-containing protein [bacterium]
IMYLKKGDMERAGKFAGVFSHIIGDIAQPIHLVNSRVLDLLIKCPEEFLSFELHTGIEGFSGRPVIKNYSPEILGNSFPRAVMGLYKKILLMAEECRYTTPLMVKAIYSDRQEQAVKTAGISVKTATLVFADFLRTAWAIAHKEDIPLSSFSLIDYPYIWSNIDMLYRYKPMKNISLIPYSGGKSYPLAVLGPNGEKKRVKGLGVIPYMGPLKTSTGMVRERDARIEFLLWPKSYSIFKATVGLNPFFKKSKGKVVFQIFADDRMIGRSKKFSPGDTAEQITVKIPENTHFLTLSMLTIEEPPSPIAETHPHGVWANPELE